MASSYDKYLARKRQQLNTNPYVSSANREAQIIGGNLINLENQFQRNLRRQDAPLTAQTEALKTAQLSEAKLLSNIYQRSTEADMQRRQAINTDIERAKLAREEEIRVAAEARAKAEAQKAIDEANARAAKAEEEKKNLEQINKNFGTPNAVVIEQVPKASVGSSGGVNKTHQAKIHNEILADFLNVFEKMTEEQVKEAIKLIAMGKIRNLKIVY